MEIVPLHVYKHNWSMPCSPKWPGAWPALFPKEALGGLPAEFGTCVAILAADTTDNTTHNSDSLTISYVPKRAREVDARQVDGNGLLSKAGFPVRQKKSKWEP